MRLHARLQASEIAASSFRPVQIHSKFQKTDNTRRSTVPRSTKPENVKPKNGRTRCHAPPKSFDTPRHSPSNLCKPVQNFTKLTVQGSSAALDLQDLKISSQDAQPRASTRHQRSGDHQRLFTRRHAPIQTPHALDAPSADTCPLRMTSWMTSSSTTRFD